MVDKNSGIAIKQKVMHWQCTTFVNS